MVNRHKLKNKKLIFMEKWNAGVEKQIIDWKINPTGYKN
jgi:hypothetical protein